MPLFCIKKQNVQIIDLEWSGYMIIKKIRYKKIIALLMIGIIIVGGLLLYKEETTNREVPKKAHFVKDNLEWNEVYG